MKKNTNPSELTRVDVLTGVIGHNKWLQRERYKLRILRGYKNE